jgi:mono/diheme cytochrome c family protein
MGKLGWFFLGALSFLLVAAVAAGVFLFNANGFSAREQPSTVERWAARRALAMAVPARAREQANPIPRAPEVLAEARAHWADHCASCHANDGSGDTEMGKHMYPAAPDMRQEETQHKTDGELFYVIKNGVRLTGMPAWGGSDHDDQDSWKLVHFIRHLPQLTSDELEEMKKLNPKSPDELKEEQEEEEFLNGGNPHEHTQHHHP